MNKYNKIISMSPDDMADFILSVIMTNEDYMINKLSMYGIDVDIVQLDPEIRKASILKDLLEDEYDT